jgi:hypothetical protein
MSSGRPSPEDMDWGRFPSFPASARLAGVVGDRSELAPYVVRVKVPSGAILKSNTRPSRKVLRVAENRSRLFGCLV